MAMRRIVPVVLAIALVGCGSIGAIGVPWRRSSPPPPLEPAALPPVEVAELPPPGGDAGLPADGAEVEPLAQPGAATASNAPLAAGALGRTDLLGGWTITTEGDSCQLFMTLTSWTGGYRASTRGCSSDLLKSISAWNLEGSQVTLAGQGGKPVARLQPSGSNRFAGTGEALGGAVTFYR
ncbi:MAG: AprI/Inh family metalloprotease inhibitor [Bauldia sp.]